jgi:DNA ligase 1
MLFDLPAHPGVFTERNAALAGVVAGIGRPWVRHIEQFKVTDRAALQKLLNRIVKEGGEGLMLHRGDSLYRAERNDDLLKLKPFEDAEARVIAHLPGKGRYAGQLGALQVETPQGQRFRVGGGFTDTQRRDPPPVGSWVTYRFTERHAKSGLPRFPRFLRVREDFAP